MEVKKLEVKGLIKNDGVLDKLGINAPDFVRNYLIGQLTVTAEQNGSPKYYHVNIAIDPERKELKILSKTKDGYRYIPVGKFDEKGAIDFKIFVDKNVTLEVKNARISFAKEDNPKYFNANFAENKKVIDYFNSKVGAPEEGTDISAKIGAYLFTDKAEMKLTESKHEQRGPNGPKKNGNGFNKNNNYKKPEPKEESRFDSMDF